ncbi:hypothetical protein [Actinotignum schaalii]|uniref:hypothetical protein n=1 Tax=Actinotignum schaalii TaxID=59505 RepID=UPI0009DBA57D|nr:hypothetical protein [Actinotignum schaalii]WQN44785.1 hypothetical protein U4A90_07245 [Actinotignum schaalii]
MIKSPPRKIGRGLTVLLGAVVPLCGCSGNETTLHSEKLINWTKYEVTDSHELTFTAITGDPKCFKLRTVSKEADGRIEVAVIEGTPPNAPQHCTTVGRVEKLIVQTEAPALDLDVHALPAEEVQLNP